HARIVCDPNWSDEKWNSTLPLILEELYAVANKLGGMLSGEHGIGCKRSKYINRFLSEELINMHRSIKQTFDPRNILNPGKIFDSAKKRDSLA
ncbi:MAG: hypothetical protein KAG97_11630, partial [Victivallales bacterium]|nr:hypothetical protein [Victivallales bacterium]